MCDDLGIDDTKVKVWKFSDSNYDNLIFTNFENILECIKSDIDSKFWNEGDVYEYKIEIAYMTQSAIDALPEAE